MPYFGLIANEDLSSSQFRAVKMVGGSGSDFRIELMDEAEGVAEPYIGILMNRPASGEHATVSHISDLFAKAKIAVAADAGSLLTVATGAAVAGQLTTTGASLANAVAFTPKDVVAGEITNVFLIR